MKTSPLSRVSVSIPNGKKSKFNLNHDVNTTYDWGSVQPLFGKLLLPDSSINVNAEQLTRLAPMVVPTFGRVKLKNIAHFIPCEEIWPNWDAMMSQTKITRTCLDSSNNPAYRTYVPTSVPNICNNVLAAYCLAGAKVNIYFSGAVGSAAENTWYCARNTGTWSTPAGWPASTTAGRAYLSGVLGIASSTSPSTSTLTPWNYTGYSYVVRKLVLSASGYPFIGANALLTLPTISTMVPLPMDNANGTGATHSANNEYTNSAGAEFVSLEGSDLIWEYAGSNPSAGISSSDRDANSNQPVAGISDATFDGRKIRFVFKFSSFGKRLRKILIGLGYDVNLLNSDRVSILPLLSFYKAWWDSYAPERSKNFYDTNAWKLINICMASSTSTDLVALLNGSGNSVARNIFSGFMSDLGTCFATERMDCISAATDTYYGGTNNTINSANRAAMSAAIQDEIINILKYVPVSDDAGSYASSLSPAATGVTDANIFGNALDLSTGVSNIKLTQPQLDALKKAYIMVNKSSVAGMRVEEILRSLGFGDYVEECKGKFVSSSDDAIKISDVVATAATADSQLGQYGGRGLGFGKFQFSYSTNRFGYLIILSAIVPEAGYINSPSHENEAIDFVSMYNREFDGLAYEAIQKKQITGSPLISDASYCQTFGYLPTFSQWKFMSNKANGDFSLNSRKQYMTPYTLDKYIPVSSANVYVSYEDSNHPGSEVSVCSPRFTYSDLPNAGEDWRYVNKFPWNGDFNRIFSEQGDGYEWSVFSPNNNAFLYNSFEFDNFMTHNVFEIAYYAHMKPIEDSYGTYDEEHGAPNSSIKKS